MYTRVGVWSPTRFSMSTSVSLPWVTSFSFCKWWQIARNVRRPKPYLLPKVLVGLPHSSFLLLTFSVLSAVYNLVLNTMSFWIDISDSQKHYIAQFPLNWGYIRRANVNVSPKNCNYDFPKMGAGGSRPFGTFPKIHPFWWGEASLSQSLTLDFEWENDVTRCHTHPIGLKAVSDPHYLFDRLPDSQLMPQSPHWASWHILDRKLMGESLTKPSNSIPSIETDWLRLLYSAVKFWL